MINTVNNLTIYNSFNFKNKTGQILSQQIPEVRKDDSQQVPVPTLVAYMLQNKPLVKHGVTVMFSIPVEALERKYQDFAKHDIDELRMRASKSGQVLNWIDFLPQEQLKRLDKIYEIADRMKQNGGQKLGIIGIGGSKHTIENLLSLNDKKDDVVFLSAVDPKSIDAFVKKLGDLNFANILVASKSGTTLEPSVGYEYVEKVFVNKFKNDFLKQGLSQEDALKKAEQETAKHFVCITDKDETKSKLRRIANEKGYQCGIIHDDCGGRFGAFDDHSLVSLAYSGMKKEDMKKMLEAASAAQKTFLSKNLNINLAMQRAIFNTDCVLNGKNNQYDYYFGDSFEGTKLWNTQMKKESHKSSYKVSGDLIGPEFLHNSTESDLDKDNTTSFYTFNTLKNNDTQEYKAYNALIKGSYKAYSSQHPVSIIELNDLSPESIGEYIELKHFETIYTGMLLRTAKGEKHPQILPEVLQPNVSIYKNEVKQILKD
ncbi:MAG: hypothetical protein KHX03_05145 [Clostridium sp.]|nr:hypothetical protein [Clostridium sp.]